MTAFLPGSLPRPRVATRTRTASAKGTLFRLFLALVLALLVSALLLQIQGKPGLTGISLLLQGGFGDLDVLCSDLEGLSGFAVIPAVFHWFFLDNYALADTILKSIPLFICSLGVALCFHLQVWNIGAEGQFAMGAVGATGVTLLFPNLPAPLMLPAIFLGAGLLGALWAAVPALLRQGFRTNEIISTLMLNAIAILVVEYLTHGPWKDPAGMGFPMSAPFPDAAVVPMLIGRIHWGVVLCAALGIGASLMLRRSRAGFELLASGLNTQAGRYAGIHYGWLVFGVMCACGLLAAWAGCLETSATLGRLRPNVTVGYGYTAIVVAWLARLRISRILLFSLLLAGLRVGSGNLELELGVSAAFGDMMQGMILLMVLAGQFFDRYRIRLVHPNRAGAC